MFLLVFFNRRSIGIHYNHHGCTKIHWIGKWYIYTGSISIFSREYILFDCHCVCVDRLWKKGTWVLFGITRAVGREHQLPVSETLWWLIFTGTPTNFLCPKVFVCFVCHPSRDFFHSYGDVTITDEGLQILT